MRPCVTSAPRLAAANVADGAVIDPEIAGDGAIEARVEEDGAGLIGRELCSSRIESSARFLGERRYPAGPMLGRCFVDWPLAAFL